MPIDDSTIAFYFIVLWLLVGLHLSLAARISSRAKFSDDPVNGRSGRRPVPPVAICFGAALFLFPLTIAACYPIGARFPQNWRVESQQVITTPAGDVTISAAVRGRGSTREVNGSEVAFPATPTQRRFHLNLDSMTLKPHRGEVFSASQSDVLQLLGANKVRAASPAMLHSSNEIVAELQLLRDNRWPENRFQYEMTGTYAITPDDNGGPFFWLPTYAPACIPLWLLLSGIIGRRLIRRYRAAMSDYEDMNSGVSITA